MGNTEAFPPTLLNLSVPRGVPPHEFNLGPYLSKTALRKAGHPINHPSCLSAEKTGNDISERQPQPGAFQAVNPSRELLLLKYRLSVPAVKYFGTCCARTWRSDLHTELLLVSWNLSWISAFFPPRFEGCFGKSERGGLKALRCSKSPSVPTQKYFLPSSN